MRISQNSPNKTSYQFWFRKDCVTLFSCCCFHLQIIAEINKILKRTQRDLYFYCSVKKLQYFGVKTFPAWDMKRCYLQKKICATVWDFKKVLIRESHFDFSVYEKSNLTSIFKWLVAWKRSFSRQKFFLQNLSPLSTIIYHYQKAEKSSFWAQKSLRVLKFLRISIDSIVFRFHSDKGPL